MSLERRQFWKFDSRYFRNKKQLLKKHAKQVLHWGGWVFGLLNYWIRWIIFILNSDCQGWFQWVKPTVWTKSFTDTVINTLKVKTNFFKKEQHKKRKGMWLIIDKKKNQRQEGSQEGGFSLYFTLIDVRAVGFPNKPGTTTTTKISGSAYPTDDCLCSKKNLSI